MRRWRLSTNDLLRAGLAQPLVKESESIVTRSKGKKEVKSKITATFEKLMAARADKKMTKID